MKKYPIVNITIFMLLGLMLSSYIKLDNIILIMLFSLGIYLFLRKRKFYNIIGIALILFSIASFNYQIAINKFDYAKDNVLYDITADIKNIKYGDERDTITLTNVILNEKEYAQDILLYSNNKELDLQIGDKINFSEKLFVPRKNQNPGELNYFNYLFSKNIYYYSYSKDIELKGISESKLLNIRRGFYKYIDNSLQVYDKDINNTIFSVLTGNSVMEEEQTEVYKNLGILHIISVSGFHVILLKIFIDLILSIFSIRKDIKSITSILLIFFYCMLIGFPISAIRAFIFILVDFIVFIFKKPKVPIKTLSFACIIILILFPSSIYDLGFQFSFISTFAIIVVYPMLRNKKRKDNTLINSFYFTLAINILIFPLQLYYFNELPLGVFIGNLFAIPILTTIIVLSFLYLLINKIIILSSIVSSMINILFFVQSNILIGLNNIFKNLIISNEINIIDVISIYIFIFCLMFLIKNKIEIRNNKELIYKLILKLAPSYILFIFLYMNLNTPTTFNMINIGQGDSFLLNSKNYNILFDTGGNIFGESNAEKILNLLKYKKVNKLDAIFISHFDEDHTGNLKDILENYDNVNVLGKSGGEEILNKKYEIKSNYIEIQEGEEFLYDDVNIEVISSDLYTNNDSNDSVILKLTIENSSILLTGDIDQKKELSILDKNIEVDILKVPHHGSKTSSNAKFLKRTSPSVSLISVGLNNQYGHPNEEVLKLYKDKNIEVKRTDEDGFVTISFNKNSYSIYDNTNHWIRNIANERFILSISYYICIIYYVNLYLKKERKIYFE